MGERQMLAVQTKRMERIRFSLSLGRGPGRGSRGLPLFLQKSNGRHRCHNLAIQRFPLALDPEVVSEEAEEEWPEQRVLGNSEAPSEIPDRAEQRRQPEQRGQRLPMRETAREQV